MRILERNVYVGPSLYAHFPVIRVVLDLGPLEAWPSSRLGSAFVDGLLAALPGLHEHGCSFGEPGGFVKRLRGGPAVGDDPEQQQGTWLGHVLEHVAIELQSIAGEDVSFGKTRGIEGRPGVYSVVYEYAQRDEGIEAGELAIRLLTSLLPTELQAADVLLLLHGDDEWCSEYIPSKMYEYFWMGRPIWAITHRNPQMNQLLAERHAYISAADDTSSIDQTLERLWLDWQEQNLAPLAWQPIGVDQAAKRILQLVAA